MALERALQKYTLIHEKVDKLTAQRECGTKPNKPMAKYLMAAELAMWVAMRAIILCGGAKLGRPAASYQSTSVVRRRFINVYLHSKNCRGNSFENGLSNLSQLIKAEPNLER